MTVRPSLLLLLALLCLPALPSAAQAPEPATAGPHPRLHDQVLSQTRSTLPGSLSPRVRQAPDLGPVPASLPLHGITLVLSRSPEQQAELDTLLAAQQTPGSPEFHHWLTPDQFGQRFGAAESDLQAVERWLSAEGFTLLGRSQSRDRVSFSGTAAEVEHAFGTPLHRFQIDGQPHLAPAAELSLPSDLASITTAVLHLSDLRPKPRAHLTPHPAFTSAGTGQHFLTPPDLRTMYDVPPPNPNGTTSTGAGQSIAIVGQSFVNLGPGSVFQQFNPTLPANSIAEVFVPGSGAEAISPGDAAESEIDLEYASGVATNASFFLVHVGSNQNFTVFDALAYAIDRNIAPVVSISYGECETFMSAADAQAGSALFQQAATQGQTIVAASGDAGSTACAAYGLSSHLSATQQQALAVDYPASNPYVTAVGGAQLTPGTFAPGNTQFWAAAPSSTFDGYATLLGYIPETAWNESTTSATNASGGGASVFFSRPAWQSGIPGMPAGAMRLLPDIALQASGADPGFLLCTDDASFGEGGGCTPYTSSSTASTRYFTGGGTSFAAPTFAAMIALLNQAQHTLGQGTLNQSLYRLAAQDTAYASVFHDIGTGSNTCVLGNASCGPAGHASFSAGAGFDQVTGLGSLDFTHLLAALPGTAPAAQSSSFSSIQLFYSALSPGQTDQLTISVGTDNTVAHPVLPTGTVVLAIDGAVVDPSLPLPTSNQAGYFISTTYTYTAPSTPGSHIVTITYPGDAHHGPSSASASILVGNVNPVGSVALSAGNLTLPANGSGTTAVAISPSGGYTGRLTWGLALSASSNGTGLAGCYSISSAPVNGATTATLSLSIGTACPSAQGAARSSTRTRFTPLPALRAAAAPAPPSPLRPATAATTVAAGLLLWGLLPSTRRRRPIPLLLVFLVGIATASLSGCGSGSHAPEGGSSSSPAPTPGTPAVTYTFTLSAQDSVNTAIQSSTTFTLTVQ